jgi:glyoxylase-like metal-dependent hydrolase (beta-lactamase superfamily II)
LLDTGTRYTCPSRHKGDVHYLYAGDVIDPGGAQLEVDLMPGHTPGSIILLDRAESIAYTGIVGGCDFP